MKIKIDLIAKMEGHSGFVGKMIKGQMEEARMDVKEGVRLIEGMLIGRNYKDAPIVAQRICGVCPVVHNLAVIKAVEAAFGVKENEEMRELRKLLEWGQVIHSHILHLFFLALADHLDVKHEFEVFKKHPDIVKKAIAVRSFGVELVRVIGGRAVHPLTNETGGFKKVPSLEDIQKLISLGESILDTSVELGEFYKTVPLPDFTRETEYVSLIHDSEYAIYDGDVASNKGLRINTDAFENNFTELHRPREVVKRVYADGRSSYMVGAIARVNLQKDKLKPKAAAYLEGTGISFPDYNPFNNLLHQCVETIHCIEESLESLRKLANRDLTNALTQPYEVKAGQGTSAVEAPRGALYYNLDIDENGYFKDVNIITPTAQAVAHMEDDLMSYIPNMKDMPEKEVAKKISALVRSYDPCFSCCVH